jgi:hypothetical protein
MKLAEAQALFVRLMTRPEPMRPQEVERFFTGSERLTPVERVKIYADMYLWRQVEALRHDFPNLVKLLGTEPFFSLCADYLRQHPSDHPDLGKLGRRLSGYLQATGRSALSELAALEWARNEVFVEADSPALDASAIAQLDPAAFATARLRLIPAFRLLKFEHDVASVWKVLEGDGEPGVDPPPRSPNSVAVWRQGFEVFHSVIEPDESRAVERVLAHARLAEVCEAFAQRQEPTEAAFKALASWVADGWVVEVKLESNPERSS